MTNWDLIKTQFEILGKTKEQICEEHDVSRRVLNHAIEQGTWSAPTAKDDTDDLEHLAQQADILHARHQGDLLVDYITAENSFMKQLISISGDFEDAEEAKKIAETLALIKPVIMKQADNDKGGSGSGRIMIVNQFPVPQPGDDHYIAPNAVLIGEAARDSMKVVGTDYDVIEVPDYEEMN